MTRIVGTDGVTEMEGGLGPLRRPDEGSFTAMVGIAGVTEMDGAATLELRSDEGLIEIDGVSWTEIVGMGDAADGLGRAEGA